MRQYIRTSSLKLITLLVLLFCLLSLPFSVVYAEEAGQEAIDANYLQNVIDMILEKYNGQITPQQLVEGALKGMFDTMDPYTVFLTPEETENFMGSINGTFSGIGIQMELKDGFILVAKVFSGSPAEKAGLMQGDLIVQVDGTDIRGAALDQASALIMGEAGTVVKLGVIRNGHDGVKIIEITRDIISISPVTWYIVDDIGYIRLETFNSNTALYMTEAMGKIGKAGINKIILDLRGNPGGEVTQAVEVARWFVPEGLITTLDFKSDIYKDEVHKSYTKEPGYKLAVLVDGMSASASEIVAGAVKDTGAGTLIGTKTFGKAKVQVLIPILTPEASEKYKELIGVDIVDVQNLMHVYGIEPEEDEIIGYTKMTVGYYYTPDGKMIDGQGIIPDIIAEDPELIDGIALSGIQKLSQTVKPGLNDAGSDVYNAEKILKLLGYGVETPDNLLDQKTFEAVKQFQKDMKLHSYGVMDFTTQKYLNNALDGIIMKYDKQFAKAVEVLNK